MHPLTFTADSSSNGVRAREFTVGDIPGMLWSPVAGPERGPLVLLGHGGGRDSKAAPMAGRAYRLVARGFRVACIDAPGHGGRPLTETDKRERDALGRAQAAGEPVGPIVVRYNAEIAERAVPEWRRTLDALLELPEVSGPVGYFGLNLGTAIGVPLVAAESRISAAVFGMFWHTEPMADLARRITIPVEYVLQWDDEHIPRESGLALFDAFAAKEKTLHANSGAHKEVPRFEADSAVVFFARHL